MRIGWLVAVTLMWLWTTPAVQTVADQSPQSSVTKGSLPGGIQMLEGYQHRRSVPGSRVWDSY